MMTVAVVVVVIVCSYRTTVHAVGRLVMRVLLIMLSVLIVVSIVEVRMKVIRVVNEKLVRGYGRLVDDGRGRRSSVVRLGSEHGRVLLLLAMVRVVIVTLKMVVVVLVTVLVMMMLALLLMGVRDHFGR